MTAQESLEQVIVQIDDEIKFLEGLKESLAVLHESGVFHRLRHCDPRHPVSLMEMADKEIEREAQQQEFRKRFHLDDPEIQGCPS